MNYNPNIYKDTQNTSKKALSYLKWRDGTIKEKEVECDEIQVRLDDMQNAGMPTESEQKLLAAKEQELYNLEFDINAIMTEQAFMDKLIFDVRDMLNVDVVTFGDSKKHLQKVKNDIEKVNNEIDKKEAHIKKLDDSNPLKDRIRMDVIKKQDFLNKLKELEAKIGNKFLSFNAYESATIEKLKQATLEKEKLEKEIETSTTNMDKAYANFASVHKEVVDEKLNANAVSDSKTELDAISESFDVAGADIKKNTTELEEILSNIGEKEKEEVEKYDDYEHFLQHIKTLTEQLNHQNSVINFLEEDKQWLYNRIQLKDNKIKDQDKEIDELQIKLNAWKESYREFESLVNNLADLVGYDEKFSNANGNNVENPLSDLIERLEKITKYVESPAYQEQVAEDYGYETQKSISPALIGGIALGTIALTTIINK
jgi:kinesin family protein 20/centromeric protein E